jgi:hypothetical protein
MTDSRKSPLKHLFFREQQAAEKRTDAVGTPVLATTGNAGGSSIGHDCFGIVSLWVSNKKLTRVEAAPTASFA